MIAVQDIFFVLYEQPFETINGTANYIQIMWIKEINDYPFRYPYLQENVDTPEVDFNSLLGIKFLSFDVATTTLTATGSSQQTEITLFAFLSENDVIYLKCFKGSQFFDAYLETMFEISEMFPQYIEQWPRMNNILLTSSQELSINAPNKFFLYLNSDHQDCARLLINITDSNSLDIAAEVLYKTVPGCQNRGGLMYASKDYFLRLCELDTEMQTILIYLNQNLDQATFTINPEMRHQLTGQGFIISSTQISITTIYLATEIFHTTASQKITGFLIIPNILDIQKSMRNTLVISFGPEIIFSYINAKQQLNIQEPNAFGSIYQDITYKSQLLAYNSYYSSCINLTILFPGLEYPSVTNDKWLFPLTLSLIFVELIIFCLILFTCIKHQRKKLLEKEKEKFRKAI